MANAFLRFRKFTSQMQARLAIFRSFPPLSATRRPVFHNLAENRQHYDIVSSEKRPLYYQRFDTTLLETNPIVAGLLKTTFQELFPQPVSRLLDLGCGTAFYYPLLSRHAQTLVGIDVSREMLSEADQLIVQRELQNCSVQECSALELCFEQESFDAVHCWDFLHHVSDIPQALREVTRVLRPGGRFIAVEPNIMNPSIAWYHARRRSEWRLFKQNQFSLVRPLLKDFNVHIRYDNTIISFLNDQTLWVWKCANRLTSIKPFHLMSFRYIIEATKR